MKILSVDFTLMNNISTFVESSSNAMINKEKIGNVQITFKTKIPFIQGLYLVRKR